MLRNFLISLQLVVFFAPAALLGAQTNPIPNPIQGHFTSTVTLGALDKVTARTSQITAQVGETITLGTLQIKVLRAWATDPEEMPESKVFLEIMEYKSGKGLQQVFRGWMFASTPSVSALEHPVYDLWVIEAHGSPINTPVAVDSPQGADNLAPEADKKIDNLIRDLIKP